MVKFVDKLKHKKLAFGSMMLLSSPSLVLQKF